ncbi:Na+/proline symporter-like protein [Chthoniobacter flavus Ellin428]|uniref:Na+/proline symporter-like protein n=1 Tax=Chthoniobacter flavus Ellin428 TaxID=497964 RepID=B4DAD5_9BACT|nr:Na+/proline symporter-like protein [Chthoniobacter flavus Ellin428]
MQPIHLDWIDIAILVVYFAFVLGIGFVLKRYMRSSNDFFLSGRSIPAWVAGLAFLSANLGAQEVIGMAASGAKYGIMTSHFYWVGAIPAMVFVAIFMMPFYYGSKARSVPEYLKLRFDEKTRALNAVTFAVMTVFSSGISMYAMALLLNLILGWDFSVSVWLSAGIVLLYISLGRPDLGDLQRSHAVLSHRGRLRSARLSGAARCGRLERIDRAPRGSLDRSGLRAWRLFTLVAVHG